VTGWWSPRSEGSLALSYLGIRRAIGVIGTSLPFVLLIGAWALDGVGVQGSISDYYYTVMRNVFVGSMVANGVFFVSYRYARADSAVATLIGVAAIVLALFPTTPVHPTPTETAVGTLHFVAATVFFLALAGYSFFIFTMTDPSTPMTPEKRKRNVVYRVGGIVIVGCLALIALINLLPTGAIDGLQPVFWLETVASVAFGVSWLVKGETLLKDAPETSTSVGSL
jgi:hypothetical protein